MDGVQRLRLLICFLFAPLGSIFGNSYEWISLKELPAPEDIVAFTNRPPSERSHRVSSAQKRQPKSQGARNAGCLPYRFNRLSVAGTGFFIKRPPYSPDDRQSV